MHVHTSNQPVVHLGFGDWTANWGFHMCGLYETEQERDGIIMGFLNQGDREGDLQLYCPTERSAENFRDEYVRRFPETPDRLHDLNRFQILSASELYYPDGTFSPWAMDEGLNAFFSQSQKAGPRNIRATAEMVWALEAIPGIENLMVYESRLNYFIPGKPWVSICMYNVNKFSGATIMQVLRTHPFTVSGEAIFQNPYFVDPDRWLAENAPEFLPSK
ncbi:MAG: MEDS domain-containing protein [Thermodesulfobacteriota bacterium]